MKTELIKIIRAIVSRAMIVVVTLIIFLLIAEVVTRAFSTIQPPLTIRDLEIGKKYFPNFSGKVFISESQQDVHLKFNKDGFRGVNREYEKPKNTCRILVLGDSQIAAIATDENETLVRQLERMLNENHPAINWEVFNFGVSGASTAQEVVLYRKLAVKYDPDLVICAYFVGNDFSDNCDRLDSNPRIYMDIDEKGNLYVKPFSVTRKTLSIWLNQHSRFYVWQKYKFKVAIKTVANSEKIYKVRGGHLIFMNKDSDDLNHAWTLNEKIIHQFYDEVVNDKKLFLFIVVPSSVQLYDDNWEEFFAKDNDAQKYLDIDYPDRKLFEIVSKKEVDSIFLRDVLEKYIKKRPHNVLEAQVLYGGGGHLNEVGNLLSAKAIYTHLVNNGTISQVVEKHSKR